MTSVAYGHVRAITQALTIPKNKLKVLLMSLYHMHFLIQVHFFFDPGIPY